MKVSPAVAGFLKGLLTVVVFAVVGFIGDVNNLDMIFSPVIAGLIASVVAAVESSMKASANGTTALFGAVSVKK